MDSYYGLFSVFSICYAILLTILFMDKGLGQVIYPIILFVSTYNFFEVNPDTNMYIINETLVSPWLFHPLNLFGGILLAVIVSIFAKMDLD